MNSIHHSHPAPLTFLFPIHSENIQRVRAVLHHDLGWFYLSDAVECLRLSLEEHTGCSAIHTACVDLLDAEEFSHDFYVLNEANTEVIQRTLVNEYGLLHAAHELKTDESYAFRKWLISTPFPAIRRALCSRDPHAPHCAVTQIRNQAFQSIPLAAGQTAA